MKRSNLLVLGVILSALVLTGAGCSLWPSDKQAAPTTPPTTSKTTPSQPVVTPTEPVAEIPTVTLPAIDNTWKTHTNTALGFSFQWPTKGKYAPTWEVTFLKDNDPAIQDGCAADYMDAEPSINLTLNGISFCHSSNRVGYPGSGPTNTWMDRYTTKKGSQYILISFEKSFSPTDPNFDVATYRQFLDQILSTFKYEE